MTLNMALLTEWGIWTTSDFRLTRPDGTIYSDRSNKHLGVRCRDGTILISYTGLGQLRETYSISDWIREVLRGHQYLAYESIDAILAYGSQELAPKLRKWKLGHAFQIILVKGERAQALILTNMHESGDARDGLLDYFESYKVDYNKDGNVLMTGAWQAVNERDRELLTSVAGRKPRRIGDIHGLLSAVNRWAARQPRVGRLISPGCISTFMPLSGEPLSSRIHTNTGEVSPIGAAPLLLFGIDLTYVMDDLTRQFKLMGADNPKSNETSDLDGAADRTVRTAKPRVYRIGTLADDEEPN